MFLQNNSKELKLTPKFFFSSAFVWLIAALAFVFWLVNAKYTGIFVMLLVIAILFCVCRDTTPVIVVSVLMWFGLNDIDLTKFDIILLSIGFVAVVAGIIVHFIRFKPDFSFLRANKIKGYTFAMFLILPSVVLGGVGVANRNYGVLATILAITIAISLLYVLLFATTQNYQKDKLLKDLARLFMVMGVLICLQMLIILLKCGSIDEIKEAIKYRKFFYGWAHPNNVAILLSLSIATTLYFATKLKKAAFVPILLAGLEFGVMLLTTSRGAILVTGVALPIMAIFVFVKAQNRKQVGICFAVCIVLAAVLALIMLDEIKQMFGRVFELGLSDNGRFEIYGEAVARFKTSPFFGVGLDYDFGFWGEFQVYWYHSTFFQILACFGIFGMLSFAYFFVMRYRAFLIKPSTVKLAVLLGLLMLEAYGMIDIVFFNTYTYMIMMILCLGAEKSLNDEQGLAFPKIKRKTLRLENVKSVEQNTK